MKTRKIRINRIGMQFGEIIIIKRLANKCIDGRQYIKYLGKCSCGSLKIYDVSNLTKLKSCGCINKLPSGEAAAKAVFNSNKHGAKNRNIKFNISFKDFKNITQQNCFYCGAAPSNKSHPKRSNGEYIYNGIDRVNNNKGYIIDNIVACCWICNNAKAQQTKNEFLLWAKQVARISSDGIITSIV